MANLARSTRIADTAVEQCLCTQSCGRSCTAAQQWHSHADDPCPIHTDRLVDAALG